MLLNGFNVTASLIKKGEDSGMTRTDMAKLYSITKSDLTAAREKTGCYSLTRFHLNEAARLLEIDPSDLVYRVTPNMLKTDGDAKIAVTGQQGAGFGATKLDPNADYTASLTSNPSIDRLVVDSAASADAQPKEYKTRLELLMATADQVEGSLVASMIGFCSTTHFARYNAKRISDMKDTENHDYSDSKQAAGITHLVLALFGAASTGTALGMLRRFITTGQYSNYNEVSALEHWLRMSSIGLLGKAYRKAGVEHQANIRFSNLSDKAFLAKDLLGNNANTSVDAQGRYAGDRITDAVMTKSIGKFTIAVADALRTRRNQGDSLDLDTLVSKANKLLANTPQMIRKQV